MRRLPIDLHCENCGATLEPRIATSRVVDCEQCGSTSVLVDDAFRLAGKQGVFHVGPSLIEIGRDIRISATVLTPVGHCQFDYGRGVWDEYWCIDHSGNGAWLSVDEGDYALERPVDSPNGQFSIGDEHQMGDYLYRAVEIDSAHCTAFRGELPEALELGERHDYVVFAGNSNRMATLERWPSGHSWTRGRWYSAWDIKTR